jgi:hypothetical protein
MSYSKRRGDRLSLLFFPDHTKWRAGPQVRKNLPRRNIQVGIQDHLALLELRVDEFPYPVDGNVQEQADGSLLQDFNSRPEINLRCFEVAVHNLRESEKHFPRIQDNQGRELLPSY